MNTHTPGPYAVYVSRLSDRSINVVHVLGPQGQGLAQVSNYTDAETLANARIFAAAPELLSALQMMVDEKVDYMRINNLGDPETQHTVKAARDAIAKAEGRP